MNFLLSNKPVQALTDLGLLILRVFAGGFIFLLHGKGKFTRLISGEDIRFGDPIGIGSVLSFYLATFAEAICAILIVIGLKTRLASIPLIITMAVVVFFAHGDDPMDRKETPLLYLGMFLILFIFGGGRISLDRLISGKN